MQTEATTDPAALLLGRLESIAESLRESEHAMALLGLGSVGREPERIDAFSDLDFFVVVEPGFKQQYIDDLNWLVRAQPLEWSFKNTRDGHKAMMADGVLCEFAVFEPHELATIPFAPGRLVWAVEGFDVGLVEPKVPMPASAAPDETWIVGEALSCLLVGMQRWHRGEKLSAARFVQTYVVERLIELDTLRHQPLATAPKGDPFNRERRLEVRQRALAEELPRLVPGYTQTPAAARAALDVLVGYGAQLNPAIVRRIQESVAAALVG